MTKQTDREAAAQIDRLTAEKEKLQKGLEEAANIIKRCGDYFDSAGMKIQALGACVKEQEYRQALADTE